MTAGLVECSMLCNMALCLLLIAFYSCLRLHPTLILMFNSAMMRRLHTGEEGIERVPGNLYALMLGGETNN